MTAARLYALGLSVGLFAALVGVSCDAPTAPHADFPLAGRHAEVTCATCHGDYPTPYDALAGAQCTECHLTTLDGRIEENPGLDHPWRDSCGGCHTAGLNWEQVAAGPHDFPRQHGNAGGSCNACHDEPASPTNWSCVTCHTQREDNHTPAMWQDSRCLECHPDGRE